VPAPEYLFRLLAGPAALPAPARHPGQPGACALTAALDTVQPQCTRHPAMQRQAGLTALERRGHRGHCRIAPERSRRG